jgi:hypothetical protein
MAALGFMIVAVVLVPVVGGEQILGAVGARI